MISYIATPTGLAAVLNGKQYTITSDNPSYQQVLDALAFYPANGETEESIEGLFQVALAVRRFSDNEIEVNEEGNELYYQGERIHNLVVDRILEFMARGLPAKPLVRFLKNLLDNPSRRSVEELYKFLEHKNMPVTEDGCFLAYKGVNDDYTDCHTGKVDNTPGGEPIEMKRNDVDDDARRACSNGYHVGSLEYATGFGSRTVIVKVNPKDVVSVPYDSNCQKLRTAKYEVVADFEGAISRPFVKDVRRPYSDKDNEVVSFWTQFSKVFGR